MSDSRYYTPSIEEFHVGFEYEFQTLKGWEKKTFNANDGGYYNNVSEIQEGLSEENIRVKYLDREDIESLGFEFFEPPEGKTKIDDYFRMTKTYPQGKIEYRLRTIGDWTSIWSEDTNDTYFDGTIKNKSQLKQILQWTGILK